MWRPGGLDRGTLGDQLVVGIKLGILGAERGSHADQEGELWVENNISHAKLFSSDVLSLLEKNIVSDRYLVVFVKRTASKLGQI